MIFFAFIMSRTCLCETFFSMLRNTNKHFCKGVDSMSQTVYFSDNFFSAGKTEIFNEGKERVGELDLKSAFSASVDVLDGAGNKSASGKFSFFGGKWVVKNGNEADIGELKARFSFFSKKFRYDAFNRGSFEIKAEPFSHLYEVYDEASSHLVAKFEKISGFFSSPAYRLSSFSDQFTTHELIAVVMGVNAIQKQRNSSSANNGAI